VSQLPSNWAVVPFGDLNRFASRTIDPARSPKEAFELYSVPSFPTGIPEIQLGAAIGSTKQQVEPNDVLVCKINPRINRVWQVGLKQTQSQIASSEWIVIRAPEVDARFLRYYFSSPEFREFICQEVTGVGGSLTRAQPKRVATFRVPIAPLNEQKRIADKLDAVVARMDTGCERLDRVPGILKRFRQSVLAAATSGELTENWRREQRLVDEWSATDVQSIAQIGTGSTPLRSNRAYYASSGTPWITSAATAAPIVMAAEEFVTDAAIAAHHLRVYPVGTLLVAMYGEGKTRGQVTELGIAATINQACAAIVVDEDRAQNAFVKLALQANYMEMRDLAEGGNQPNLNLSKIKEFPLRLPSIDEQAEIVNRVGSLFAYADRVLARYSAARDQIERVTPALLAKAFRGELVPQDPHDEPASVLLERIAAARGAAPPKSKSRKSPDGPKNMHRAEVIMLNRKDILDTHLTAILRRRGPLSAEALWAAAQLDVDDFYEQLKDEEARGLLKERRGDAPTTPRLLEAV
jgi:type I restriction enzyme S subunit